MKEKITLNNGVEMPMIGYGVYQITASITERCVNEALYAGYIKREGNSWHMHFIPFAFDPNCQDEFPFINLTLLQKGVIKFSWSITMQN